MKKNRLPSCRKFRMHKEHTILQKKSYHFINSCLMVSLLFTILSSFKEFDELVPAGSILPGLKKMSATSSATGDEFTVVVMPDTQNYTAEKKGALREMFYAQIAWIKANKMAENIMYVAGVGDITDCGDKEPPTGVNSKTLQWNIAADSGYYNLEAPLPGLPNGIPYGLTVGNHDQLPTTRAFRSLTTKYNEKFGRDRFVSRKYWGSAFNEPCKGPENAAPCFQNKNDNHYDFFTVNGQDYIVFHIEYDDPPISDPNGVGPYDDQNDLIIKWVAEKLAIYSERKAIIVTHSGVQNAGTFTPQGARIYNRVKSLPNVFVMFAGHISGPSTDGLRDGEAYRQRTYQGRTVKSFLSNYQGRIKGGGGLMRLYTFSLANDLIRVRTINPYTGIPETDIGSEFVKPLFHGFTTTRTSDFDNNGKSQLSVFNSGIWKVKGMADVNFGSSGDIAIHADYDGDGKTDYAYYRPSDQTFNIQGKSSIKYGLPGDIPVPGDYQDDVSHDNVNDNENTTTDNTPYKLEKADGITDIAIWRPSTGQWLIKDQTLAVVNLGQPTDIPVPADYDGDGKVNFAIYKTAASTWHILNNPESGFTYGLSGDIPVPGDYNGDGKVDIAIFRRSKHFWYIRGQSGADLTTYLNGDIPVPGDYDGDGRTDMALYRPSTGEVFVHNQSTISTGLINGKPLNLPYHIRKFFFK